LLGNHLTLSQVGRDLAHWHLNYEAVAPYEGVTIEGSAGLRARSTPPAAKAGSHPSNAASTPTSPGSGSSASFAPTTSCGLGGPRSFTAEHYRVEKMKFAKTRAPETNKSINDKTTVHYNDHITLRDIPEAAYTYIVNGKPALEWVMERQCVKPDPDSGIINDANLWATETMGNPKYPLELFLRVITVSLETMKIVEGLPKLDI
jgi:predicted helicase